MQESIQDCLADEAIGLLDLKNFFCSDGVLAVYMELKLGLVAYQGVEGVITIRRRWGSPVCRTNSLGSCMRTCGYLEAILGQNGVPGSVKIHTM